MGFPVRWLALAAVVTALTGCATVQPVASFKGQPVPTVDGLAMTCNKPHVLSQDCSIWSGATRRLKVGPTVLKVAGSPDGRIVLVMTDKLVPSHLDAEQAADAALQVASTAGAKVVATQALAAGPSVVGYILHFDADVYTSLKPLTLGS